MTGKDLIKDGDLIADGFDDCIIGVAEVIVDGEAVRKVVYSASQMIDQLKDVFAPDCEPDEDPVLAAVDFLEYNTFCAYVGPKTPLYIYENGVSV